MNTKAKEQPLNVEMGKREADAYMRRRDRMQRIARERATDGQTPQDQLQRWIDDTFPAGFPREWFR